MVCVCLCVRACVCARVCVCVWHQGLHHKPPYGGRRSDRKGVLNSKLEDYDKAFYNGPIHVTVIQVCALPCAPCAGACLHVLSASLVESAHWHRNTPPP